MGIMSEPRESLLSVTRISPCIKYEEIVHHDVTEGYLPHHEARCRGGECVGQGRRLVPADQGARCYGDSDKLSTIQIVIN